MMLPWWMKPKIYHHSNGLPYIRCSVPVVMLSTLEMMIRRFLILLESELKTLSIWKLMRRLF